MTKSGMKKIILIIISVVASIAFSIGVTLPLSKNPYLFKTDFLIDELETENISFKSSDTFFDGNDPKIYVDLRHLAVVSGVTVELYNISETELDLQVFWDNETDFSEKHSVSHHINTVYDDSTIKINRIARNLRIDPGDEYGLELGIKNIGVSYFSFRPVLIFVVTALLFWGILFRIYWLCREKPKVKPGRTVIRMACIVTVFALLTVCINISTFYLSKDNSYELRNPFYESNDCEVLIVGTSHVFDGIFPMEMWRDYGISSYDLASSGERILLNYYSLKDAMEVHLPKVVVVDVYGLNYKHRSDFERIGRIHTVFDYMKTRKVMIEGILDGAKEKDWGGLFFPLAYYHDRWPELGVKDLKKGDTFRCKARGGKYRQEVKTLDRPTILDIEDHVYEDNYGTEYLEKIIELCEEKDVPVLLTLIPYQCPAEVQQILNRANDIAKEHENVEYVNFLYDIDDIGLDFSVNMADEGHLNGLGARKMTKYLGKYLTEHYELTDYRNDKDWQDAYLRYQKECKEPFIDDVKNLNSYLMLIADPDYTGRIYLPKDYEIRDEITEKLIAGINEISSMELKKVSDLNEEITKDYPDDIFVEVYNTSGELVARTVWNQKYERDEAVGFEETEDPEE